MKTRYGGCGTVAQVAGMCWDGGSRAGQLCDCRNVTEIWEMMPGGGLNQGFEKGTAEVHARPTSGQLQVQMLQPLALGSSRCRCLTKSGARIASRPFLRVHDRKPCQAAALSGAGVSGEQTAAVTSITYNCCVHTKSANIASARQMERTIFLMWCPFYENVDSSRRSPATSWKHLRTQPVL